MNTPLVLTIRKGATADIPACVNAVSGSLIGTVYFSSESQIASYISEGIHTEEVDVAITGSSEVAGFIRYTLKGAFGLFPYLQTIAIRPAYRCQGVASTLMQHFEDTGFKKAKSVFLLTSDFNEHAQQIYIKRGYCLSGTLPNLIVKGITELMFTKTKT